MRPFQLIIISSPSGAGKTTLCRMLLADEHFGRFRFSVSHTTRPPRANETEGVDYYFTSRAAFDKMVARRQFAEHARVHGNFYGTSVAEIRRLQEEGGSGIIFDIDYQGARQLKHKFPDALAVFNLPPSIHELRARLEKRGTETPASLQTRLGNAIRELGHYTIFDHVVVNDVLETAYRNLKAVITAHRFSRAFSRRLIRELTREWKESLGEGDGTG